MAMIQTALPAKVWDIPGVNMKCTICNVTIEKEPLYRNNKKGEKGIWRCWDHLDEEYKIKHGGGFKDTVTTIHKAGN